MDVFDESDNIHNLDKKKFFICSSINNNMHQYLVLGVRGHAPFSRYSKANNISPCHCKCLQGVTLESVTRSHTARGSETAITGTSGRSIVETTSSARTIERSLADVATVDTFSLFCLFLFHEFAIVFNQLINQSINQSTNQLINQSTLFRTITSIYKLC